MHIPSLWRLTGIKLKKKDFLTGIGLGIVLLIAYLFSSPDGKLHLYFLDVGQGDSALVVTPKAHNIMIDGGPDTKSVMEISKILPFYRRDFDLVFLTHPHADHLTGLLEVIKRYDIKYIVMSEVDYSSELYNEWLEVIASKNIPVKYAYAGDEIDVDDVSVEVLWPKDKESLAVYSKKNINDASLVLLLKHGRFATLFSGDASSEVESQIKAPKADVFKFPHHGSLGSLNTGFLDAVNPKYVIVSVGKNSYGHPASAVLGAFSARDIQTLRTDERGTIEITTDGLSFSVQ
jgi:competence protein ComEC